MKKKIETPLIILGAVLIAALIMGLLYMFANVMAIGGTKKERQAKSLLRC